MQYRYKIIKAGGTNRAVVTNIKTKAEAIKKWRHLHKTRREDWFLEIGSNFIIKKYQPRKKKCLIKKSNNHGDKRNEKK